MAFNYQTQAPKFQLASKSLIEGASKSPFSIAGNTMSKLNEDIQSRIFSDKASQATSLQELSSIRNPQTEASNALIAQRGNLLNMIGAEKQRGLANKLAKDKLTEIGRHNLATEGVGKFAPKGFGSSVDPITGQTRIYNKDTGIFGETLGGSSAKATDSGEPISSKTAVKAMPDGTTIYTNRAGEPLLKDGQVIVKTRSKFNLDKPSEIAGEQATMDSLKKIKSNVESNPDAVGSLGSGAWNFVSNNINDMLKIPTDTRLARNQITASAGVLAANIRSMFEKGVMTEPDFERYKRLVPNENDSVEEFTHKLNTLQEELSKSMKAKAKMQGTKAPVVKESNTVEHPFQKKITRTIGNETRYWDGKSWVK